MSELPNGWSLARLGDVSEVRLGRQRSPSRATGDRMRPYLRAANATWKGLDLTDVKEMDFTESESVSYELRPGDLLLSEASGSPGEVGKPVQYRGEIEGCCFQNTLLRVRLPAEMLPDLYEYFFRGEALNGKFADGSRGVGIHHLGAAAFADWTVPIVPASEQQRIVRAVEEAFSKLDAGEVGLYKVRQQLKQLRNSVLAAAVTGRLVPNCGGEHVFLQEGTDEQSLGDPLPIGWVWSTIEAVSTSLRNGIFVSRPAEFPPGVPILRIGSVRRLALDLTDVRYANVDPADAGIQRAILEVGDLLFTRYNGNPEFVGACAEVPRHTGSLLHPDKLIRVVVDRKVATPSYVAIASSIGASRTFIDSVTKTTAGQAGIAGSELKQMPLPLPPLLEQNRIVAEVERQFSFIEAAERAVETGLLRSAALRRSILKAAFEGRLVRQDPTDEPASVLLDRIRAERLAAASTTPKKTRSKVAK
jgi:type I restriction enzyme, S subunit